MEASKLRPFQGSQILIINSDGTYLNYDTGDIKTLDYLPIELLAHNSGFICGRSLYIPLSNISEGFRNARGIRWRMKVTNPRRKAYTRNGEMTVLGTFQIAYLSFLSYSSTKVDSGSGRWDILNLENFVECSQFTLQEMAEASLAILTLCQSRGITFKSSRGALSGQLLKASKYWVGQDGKSRRPAPKFINDVSRNHLPGNHYSVSDKVTGRSLDHCYYVDQNNSHHTIAGQIHIAHPEFLRARGHYKKALKKKEYKKWISQVPRNQAGLFLCRVEIKTIVGRLRHLYPKWIIDKKPGGHFIWIWSPELHLFDNDHHVKIDYIVCGFCTDKHDLAITEYSYWALEQLEKPGKKYIKSTLLAAYGMLAFNPTGYKSYRYWVGNHYSRGSDVVIPEIGKATEVCVKLPDHVQSNYTNVIARGLIESETRARSLKLARELSSQKLDVVQVYADGLVIETDRLPFLPDEWRVSHSLTNVRIPRANAIISDQMVKMPGMTREESEKRFRSRIPFIRAGSIPMETHINV